MPAAAPSDPEGVAQLDPEPDELLDGPPLLRRRLTRRRVILLGAGLAFSIVGIGLLVGKAAGYAKLLEHLRDANPEWIALALVTELLSVAGYIAVYRAAAGMASGPDLGIRVSSHAILASFGVARLLPAGGAGGLGFSLWALNRSGLERRGATLRFVALNLAVFGVFLGLATVAAITLLAGFGGAAPPHLAIVWLICAPAVVAAAFASRLVPPGRSAWRLVARLRSAATLVAEAMSLATAIARRPVENRAALAGILAYWLGDVAALWSGLRAFNESVPVAALFLAYATGYVTALLPLPANGIGTVDAAFVFALKAVGVPLSTALLGVVAYRVVSYWLPTLPGLIALARTKRLVEGLDRTAAAHAKLESRVPTR